MRFNRYITTTCGDNPTAISFMLEEVNTALHTYQEFQAGVTIKVWQDYDASNPIFHHKINRYSVDDDQFVTMVDAAEKLAGDITRMWAEQEMYYDLHVPNRIRNSLLSVEVTVMVNEESP